MRIKRLKPGFKELTEAKARLIAHLIGDGCAYKCRTDYNIKYDITDPELLQQFVDDLDNVYGLKPVVALKPSGKTGKLLPYARVRSKLAYEDLKSYCDYFSRTWTVPKEIIEASKSIKREFLKALYDDEGSVIPEGRRLILRLYSINFKGLKQVQKMISEFGIENTIKSGFGAKRNVFAIVIKDIEKFYKEIGFYCVRKQEKIEKYVKARVRTHTLPSESPLPDLNRGFEASEDVSPSPLAVFHPEP